MSQATAPITGKQDGPEWQVPQDSQRISYLAVASLVFSLLCLTGILGVVFGVLALWRITVERGRLAGKSVAVAGIILGLISSSILMGMYVGAAKGLAEAKQMFYDPAGEFFSAVESRDLAGVRGAFDPAAGAVIDQEAVDTFAKAIADLGPPSGAPDELGDAFDSYSFRRVAGGLTLTRNTGAGVFKFQRGLTLVVFEATEPPPPPSNFVVAQPFPKGKLVSVKVLRLDGTHADLAPPAPKSKEGP